MMEGEINFRVNNCNNMRCKTNSKNKVLRQNALVKIKINNQTNYQNSVIYIFLLQQLE